MSVGWVYLTNFEGNICGFKWGMLKFITLYCDSANYEKDFVKTIFYKI